MKMDQSIEKVHRYEFRKCALYSIQVSGNVEAAARVIVTVRERTPRQITSQQFLFAAR
jgi:hypothetical protein